MSTNNHLASKLAASVRLAVRLACAPFTGAARCIRQQLNRPANSWQDVARNDVLLYFAPLVGAIDGVREVWRHRREL